VSKLREVFNDYLPDVWIYTDLCKGKKGGNSPGYAINLIAESNTGSFIGVDECLDIAESSEDNAPEKMAERSAKRLLDEIFYSGFVDS